MLCRFRHNLPSVPGAKPIVWMHGEVKSPPFSAAGRAQAGALLRLLQEGESIAMPSSRPMPIIGKRCHELRINDEDQTWRIVYRIEPEAIVVLEVFAKKTRITPKRVIDACKARVEVYQDMRKGKR